jgi:hypothetical protein
VQRLAESAQQPMRYPHLRSLRLGERLPGLSVLAHAAVDVRYRRLRSRP